jgi:hypothetical protein
MREERQESNRKFGCQEFDANLAAYLEGEENSDLRSHAEECSACGILLDDIEAIRSAARELPLESPSPRVWSNIRATLAQEGYIREQESFWQRWAGRITFGPRMAPVAALAFALTLAIVLLFHGDIQQNVNPAPALPSVAERATPVSLSDVQTNLIRTVQGMEENYKAREASLDPSAKQVYAAGLASLDSSIRECMESLRNQPENMLAREYLMRAYAQKAEVLASALEYGGR